MKVTMIKVSKYSYEGKTDGAIHEGCVVSILTPSVENENNIGYDVKEFRMDIKLFDKMKSLYLENKPVDLVMDYVPMRNGNYYAKAISIGGIEI